MAAFETFQDVITWRNRTASFACLVGVNLFYFLIFCVNKCLLSMLCWVSLFLMSLGFVLKCVDGSESSDGVVEVISKKTIEDYLLYIYDLTNDWTSTLRDIVLWRDAALSAKIAALTVVTGYVSSFFSLPTVIFLVVWAVFGGSLITQQYRQLVEPMLQPVIRQMKEVLSHVWFAIPKMDDAKKIS